MIERGDRVSFLLESRTVLALQLLDRDDPIQPRIESLPHFSHASRAEGREDLVRAEFVAYGEGHGGSLSLSNRET